MPEKSASIMSLKIFEAIAIFLALLLGVLWYLNPDGSFEALSFMSMLLGVTVTDYIRRHLSERDHKQAHELLLGELARLFEEKFSRRLDDVDEKTRNTIKTELLDAFPTTIKEALALMARANTELNTSKPNDAKPRQEYPVKSLAEAYGIESTAYQFGEMSIYEAKGNRAKSKKNA
jgi:response regulator RpfG family c-di-GMP phosphodiesterase